MESDSKSVEITASINGLLDALQRFNAKERFYLVGYFLGNQKFRPDKDILIELEDKLGFPKGVFSETSDNAVFCAMDYHLDWLNGALELAFFGKTDGDRNGNRVTGSQEDIDLLLAFKTPNESKPYHLVLVEAKGVISFSNSQLESKIKRLEDIFYGNDGQTRFKDLEVHMVLAAPRPPTEGRLNWPSDRLKPVFMDLPMPKNLLKITRTDESGNATKKDWSKWRIDER